MSAPLTAPLCNVDVAWLTQEGAIFGEQYTPKRSVVVGGSGMVGANLVVLLANAPGCELVKVLDIAPLQPEVLAGISDRVEFSKFQLGTDSLTLLSRLLEGADCVFSVVTPSVEKGTREEMYATNVDGVQHLVQACREQGVKRLVHLSSIAVSNHFVDSSNQTEADPLAPMESYKSAYDISKRRGEALVLQANGQANDGKVALVTCSLRAGGIFASPWDYFWRHVWPVVPGAIVVPVGKVRIDCLDVRDVARALLVAAQKLEEAPSGVAGEAFWLTKGDALVPGEVARTTAKAIGCRFFVLPQCVLYILSCFAAVAHKLKRALGCRVPAIPLHWFMEMAQVEQTFDNSKIQQRLDFHPKITMQESSDRIIELYQSWRKFKSVKPDKTQK